MKKLFLFLLLSLGLFAQPGYEGKSGYSQNILWRDLHPSTQDSITAIVTGSSVTYNNISSTTNDGEGSASTVTPTSVAGNLYNVRFRDPYIITLSIGASDRVVGAAKGEDIVLAGGNGMEYKLLWVDDSVAVLSNDGGGRTNPVAGVYDVKDMRGWGHDSIAVRLAKDAIEARGGGTVHFGADTYDLSGMSGLRFTKPLMVSGDGQERTIVGADTGSTIFDVTNSTEVRDLTFRDVYRPVQFYRMGDNSVGTDESSLIVDNVRFHRVVEPLFGQHPSGMQYGGNRLEKVSVTNCRFDSTNYGVHIGRIELREAMFSNLLFRHLHFSANDPHFGDNRELRALAVGFDDSLGMENTIVTVRDVTIDTVTNNNSAQVYLIYHARGPITVENLTVREVTTKDTTDAVIAAIYIRNEFDSVVKNCKLYNAGQFFGAIAVKGGSGTVSGSLITSVRPQRIFEGNIVSYTDAYKAAIAAGTYTSGNLTYGIKIENPSAGDFNIRGLTVRNADYGVYSKSSQRAQNYHLSGCLINAERGIEVANAAKTVKVDNNTVIFKTRGIYVTGEFGVPDAVDVSVNTLLSDSAGGAPIVFQCIPLKSNVVNNTITRLVDSLNTVTYQDSGFLEAIKFDTTHGFWRKNGASGGAHDSTHIVLIDNNKILGVDYNTRTAIDLNNTTYFAEATVTNNKVNVANRLYRVPACGRFYGANNVGTNIRLAAQGISFAAAPTSLTIRETMGDVKTQTDGMAIVNGTAATVTHGLAYDNTYLPASKMVFNVTPHFKAGAIWIKHTATTTFKVNWDSTASSDTLYWSGRSGF